MSSHGRVWVGFLVVFMMTAVAGRADLTHRYSFSFDASDSVGTADGTLYGNVYADGSQMIFDGAAGSYVDLGGGLITSYTDVTFEFWISPSVNGNWCELYAFGDQNEGGAGRHMLMFTPHSGSGDHRMSFADGDPGYSHEFVVNAPGVLDYLGPIHVACVYDFQNRFMRLYANGILAGSRSSDLGDFYTMASIWNVYSWLGRSLYNGDAAYAGTIDEFRIYDTAQNAVQIAGSFAAGPDTVSSDPGAPIALHVTVNSNVVRGGVANVTVTADFAGINGVNLAGVPGFTLTSSDTNIFTVSASGQISALRLGSATLTASYGGVSEPRLITVVSGLPTTLRHRYSFSADYDATDSIGGAHGAFMGNAQSPGGQLVLDGQSSYIEFPQGMLTNYDSITMEAWVTDNGSAGWARIWDFGNSTGGAGTQYLMMSLPSGGGNLRGCITITGGGAGEQIVEWLGNRPAAGTEAHVVWTADGAFQTGCLYVNGVLVGSNTNLTLLPRDMGHTYNNWLGRSQFNDPYFIGSINEFRIYDGALTPLQVAVSAAAGPDALVTNEGALQSVHLAINPTNVYYGGTPVQVSLYADFQNAANVNVTLFEGTTLLSSDPQIASVGVGGLLDVHGTGSVVLTGIYGGMSNTLAVTIGLPPGYQPAVLAHRYSFSETGGTTATDSVGAAHGTIRGINAVFDGAGSLILPGGTTSDADPSVIAGYVDLPNFIISALSDVTFETWATWQGSGNWQRLFDFGVSTGGEDISNGGGGYLFLTPQADAAIDVMRFAVRDPSTGTEPSQLSASAPLPTGQEVHLVVVYNVTANVAHLYSNAVLVAWGTAPVPLSSFYDVNNWLGRSQWADNMFQGSYNEFRIWNGALLPDEIASHFAAGPNSLGTPPTLAIGLAGGAIRIYWSTNDTGFQLQYTGLLGTNATWTAWPSPPVVEEGWNTITVTPSVPLQFYRLAK